MTDLDTFGRGQAEIAKDSVARFNPPDIEDLPRASSESPNPAPWIAAAAAAVAMVAVSVLIFTGGIGERTATSTPQLPTTVTQPPTSPGTTARPHATNEFDVGAFMTNRIDEVFGDFGSQIRVFALVPGQWQFEFEKIAESAPMLELEGYRIVDSSHVAEVAAAFAERWGTDPLEGTWFAAGFEPEYFDSPIHTWMDDLSKAPGVVLLEVNYAAGSTKVPKGWHVVTELPFTFEWESMVIEGVDDGALILDHDHTRFVGADGVARVGQPPPSEFPGPCCGDFESHPVPRGVVVTNPGTGVSWFMDADSLSWRVIDDRPLTRGALGSAVVSDSLIVVERGGRSIVSESRVVALDLDSLSWRSLPSLPTTIDVGDVTTDGTSVYVAGVAQDLNNNIIGLPRWPRLFVSEPGDPWTELASVPIDGQAATIGWVNDLGLLAWNYALEAALWVPGAGWRPLDDVPIPAGECYPSVETTSDGAVGHCFQSVYFDGTNLVWSPIREPYFGKIAVTPDAIYAVMDTGRATSLFIAMDLPPPPID